MSLILGNNVIPSSTTYGGGEGDNKYFYLKNVFTLYSDTTNPGRVDVTAISDISFVAKVTVKLTSGTSTYYCVNIDSGSLGTVANFIGTCIRISDTEILDIASKTARIGNVNSSTGKLTFKSTLSLDKQYTNSSKYAVLGNKLYMTLYDSSYHLGYLDLASFRNNTVSITKYDTALPTDIRYGLTLLDTNLVSLVSTNSSSSSQIGFFSITDNSVYKTKTLYFKNTSVAGTTTIPISSTSYGIFYCYSGNKHTPGFDSTRDDDQDFIYSLPYLYVLNNTGTGIDVAQIPLPNTFSFLEAHNTTRHSYIGANWDTYEDNIFWVAYYNYSIMLYRYNITTNSVIATNCLTCFLEKPGVQSDTADSLVYLPRCCALNATTVAIGYCEYNTTDKYKYRVRIYSIK